MSFLVSLQKALQKFWSRKGCLENFRETLNGLNVTVDVKHFEDCKQLFISIVVAT